MPPRHLGGRMQPCASSPVRQEARDSRGQILGECAIGAIQGMDQMTRHTIVAQFHDYGAAYRALGDLEQSGIRPNDISIIAGDRGNSHGATRAFGILDGAADFYISAVRRGITLLAVYVQDEELEQIAEIIERHEPFEIAERDPDLVSHVALVSCGADRGAPA
jgi:hypothetical protein